MEQGIYSVQFHLFENGNESTASKNLTGFVKTCKTEFIYDETYDIFDEYTYKAYKLLSGKTIFQAEVQIDVGLVLLLTSQSSLPLC